MTRIENDVGRWGVQAAATGGAWRVSNIGTFDREDDSTRTPAAYQIRAFGAERAGRPSRRIFDPRSHWSALSPQRGFVPQANQADFIPLKFYYISCPSRAP
ncbi:MAG: hypothetical protein KF886_22765 [Candidatus Hydrogenedentes bacterium]|nr:hypothetical protein [Candidatus Hydrogenedentota bacterium]